MRVPRIIPVFVCIVFAASFAFAGKVRVDYDHGVSFSKYKTFVWLEKPKTENPLMEDRIVNAINGQLLIKGLEPVTTDADLAIRVTSSTEEKETVTTYYDGFGAWDWGPRWGWGGGWGPGWGGPGYATTFVDKYLECTTVVDLIDTASEKTVWHAVSTGTISDKPDKAAKKTEKRIAEMFGHYPPVTAVRERISE